MVRTRRMDPNLVVADASSTRAIFSAAGSMRSTPAKTDRLMVFKLVNAAAKTWRRSKGENQSPKVVQGVKFQPQVSACEPRARIQRCGRQNPQAGEKSFIGALRRPLQQLRHLGEVPNRAKSGSPVGFYFSLAVFDGRPLPTPTKRSRRSRARVVRAHGACHRIR
jgi:hypothetical protein